MKKVVQILLLGLLTWIVPFIAAFPFFDQSGQLVVDTYLFKSIMIVVGGITGSFAIIIYFKKIQIKFISHAFLIGISWFVINIILDIFILIPISGMNGTDYVNQIGIRYLLLPIMCILCGYLLNMKIVSK